MDNCDTINTIASELIRRMAGHEEQAIGCFFNSTLALVYGHAISLTNEPEMAETVVADTYLQVWQQACHYNMTFGTPLGWLLQITHERALHLLGESSNGTTTSSIPLETNGDRFESPWVDPLAGPPATDAV